MTPAKNLKPAPMFRAAFIAMISVATPALAQETIPENGVQIAVPDAEFSLYQQEEYFVSRLWVHKNIDRFSIIVLNNQDLENNYTGMDWAERVYSPIVSQDTNITAYDQGVGWMMAQGEAEGNGFFQRSIFSAGCPVIATLIVTYPQEERALAAPVFERLAESLTIAPSPLCP